MGKTMGINEQSMTAKLQTVEDFGLDRATKIGDYTYIDQQEVVVDEEGNVELQYVEIALSVKSKKDTARSAAFDLDKAVAAYETLKSERTVKAAEKAAAKEAKAAKEAAKEAARQSAKAKVNEAE